jgi:hypothetical protein
MNHIDIATLGYDNEPCIAGNSSTETYIVALFLSHVVAVKIYRENYEVRLTIAPPLCVRNIKNHFSQCNEDSTYVIVGKTEGKHWDPFGL